MPSGTHEAVGYTYISSYRALARENPIICAAACNLNHGHVLDFDILIQTIWSLAQSGIVKRFKKLIDFSLWSPCSVGVDFEIVCIGRVC